MDKNRDQRNEDTIVDVLYYAVIKAETAHRIAMQRLSDKANNLAEARRRYQEAMHIINRAITQDFKNYMMSNTASQTPDGPNAVHLELVVDDDIAQPSIEAICYHFEVGRDAAEAILAFAHANNENLSRVIEKGWHRR